MCGEAEEYIHVEYLGIHIMCYRCVGWL